MLPNACPICGKPIAVEDINVGEGVGLCRACGKLSRLADIVDQPVMDPKAISAPPVGCTYEQAMDGCVVARASHRSLGAAAGFLAVSLFWNGIVSIFVLFVIAGFYTRFVGPLPQWFPMPRGNRGHGNLDESLGGLLFLCIFLTPFVLVGLAMLLGLAGSLIGWTEVRVAGQDGSIRTGLGPIFWTRRFDAWKVTKVSRGQTKYQQNGENKQLIQIDADRTLRFGTMLSDVRRAWMLGICLMMLSGKSSDARRRVGALSLSRR